MNTDKLQGLCQQLTPENANFVCEMLLEQRVTDQFVRNLNTAEIRQKRKLFQVKSWLASELEQVPGLTFETRASWKSKIDTIEDIVIQHVRDLYGNVDRRVLLFFPRTSTNRSAVSSNNSSQQGVEGSGGYLCVSTFHRGSILAAKTASLFSGWISNLAPRLIVYHDRL